VDISTPRCPTITGRIIVTSVMEITHLLNSTQKTTPSPLLIRKTIKTLLREGSLIMRGLRKRMKMTIVNLIKNLKWGKSKIIP
jgi:hypothetical protein